jgi:hypothetical protein
MDQTGSGLTHTIDLLSPIVYTQSILRVFLACADTIHRRRKSTRGKIGTVDGHHLQSVPLG